MERPEIVELFYSALVGPENPEQLFRFLSRKVEWILSAADPQTLGEESPSNALKFSGKEGFRQDDDQLARGKGHHAAVRAVAFKWIRILFACWKQCTPYDPQRYLQAL